MTDGVKNDKGKPALRRLGLVPKAVNALAAVLDYGAKKYPEADNWKRVTPFHDRYKDALARHVLAYLMGEENDPESGLPHLAHAMANASFLLEGPEKAKADRWAIRSDGGWLTGEPWNTWTVTEPRSFTRKDAEEIIRIRRVSRCLSAVSVSDIVPFPEDP